MSQGQAIEASPVEGLDEARKRFESATRRWSRSDRKALARAVRATIEAHEGQARASGEPYACHPLEVARIVVECGGDLPTVTAALLHDTVEDTPITLAQIATQFGEEVANLVDGCTKVSEVRVQSPDALEAARMRKLLVAVAQDPRVIAIKSADRLHNLRTIDALPEAKRRRIGRETLALHGPLAGRLGLTSLKVELEDRAFCAAYPDEYARVAKDLAHPERHLELARHIRSLQDHLSRSGLRGAVSGRIKTPWSAHRKAKQLGMPVDQLHDLVGLRVIMPSVNDCYLALGAVHSLWPMAEGRFKDYISRPKFNRYQSIHTSVIGQGGRAVEVQIRTPQMHAEAEHGKAAHKTYKNSDPGEPAWLQRLLDAHEEEDFDYVNSVRQELLIEEEILVITPQGDTVTLPAGSCAVDFAYAVHTEVGNRCLGVEINGKEGSLHAPLHTGDMVKVRTGTTGLPPEEWLKFATTRKARNAIKEARKKTAATRRSHGDPSANGRLEAEGETDRTLVEVIAEDRQGLLGDVATAIAEAGGDIVFSSTGTLSSGLCREVFDVAHLVGAREAVMEAASRVPSVREVSTL